MNRPSVLQPMEPDRAQEVVINLIRRQAMFVCEIDPTKVKDMVCVAIGGEFQKEPSKDYVDVTCRTMADACQLAYNCIREEVSFAVVPRTLAVLDTEWIITAERPKRRGISAA